jgi:Lon protease-like protein
MIDLPLFPLNTVLFPGMPISLHIFEDRYKKMMNTCITERIPFGVVLISEGVEALGPLAMPYTIGCSARISQVQPIGQGRMNLLAVGQERFEVLELDRESQPYLVAKVEMLPMTESPRASLVSQGEKLRQEGLRYLEILSQVGDVQFDEAQLPDDPLELAYLGAYFIRVEADQKQKLLEAASTFQFVSDVRALYRRENILLERMIEESRKPNNNNTGTFSVN